MMSHSLNRPYGTFCWIFWNEIKILIGGVVDARCLQERWNQRHFVTLLKTAKFCTQLIMFYFIR